LTAQDNPIEPWISGEFDITSVLRGAPRILNRLQFIDHVDRQLQITRRSIDQRFTLLMANLDNYANIVSEKGRTAADLLIRALVEPVGSILAPRDAIAILENGTIGILLESARLRGQAQDFAAEMVGLLKTAATDCGVAVPTVSVGIAKVTGNYAAPEDIIRDAGIALRLAESQGQDKMEMFHRGMTELFAAPPIAI
jgi:diguanylate cyclase (GGDEF)-like protein